MALTAKGKAEEAYRAAQKDWDEGRPIFAFRLVERMYGASVSMALPDLAGAIERVEHVGWQLDRLMAPSVDALTGDRTAFVMIFRRPTTS